MGVKKVQEINSLYEKAMKMDWECIDSDTQYFTHSIHRYSGKFIPQIASNAINLLTKEGDTVLDVYAGSGTTLLEAALAKRTSIGIDLSPLAVLISKVKTTVIDIDSLNQWYQEFSDQISLYLETNTLFNPKDHAELNDARLQQEWYLKWFQYPVLKELIWIDKNITSIEEEKFRNIALIALSDILRKCSNAHSSYPNVMFDKNKKPLQSAIPKFLRRLEEIVASVKTINGKIKTPYIPQIIEGSNISIPIIKSDSIDCIVTHPPYIGSVPYAEYGLLSLTWLGHDAKDLDLKLTGGKRQSRTVVTRFEEDYEKMFKEANRVLKPFKHFFILVGNPTVKGETIDLAKMSDLASERNGFSKALHFTRSGSNRRANKMGEEHIIVYEKISNL